MSSNRYTAPYLRGRADWTPEKLAKLQELLEQGASIDTLAAAFNGIGPTTLLCGCRLVVAQMARNKQALRAELDAVTARPPSCRQGARA